MYLSQSAADRAFDALLMQLQRTSPRASVPCGSKLMWVDDRAFVLRSADGTWTKHCRMCHAPVGRCRC